MFPELPTPAVLVDGCRLRANLEAAQRRAEEAGVALRPHVKTHRSLEIAGRQRALGAKGITCAKPSEAEVFVAGGFDDVRVAYPVVGRHRLDRLVELAGRARVSFCVDSVEAGEAAGRRFREAGRVAEVLLKIDCGYGRAGWRWDDAELGPVACRLASVDGLEIVGVLTHAGQSYGGTPEGESSGAVLAGHARDERDRTQAAADVVAEAIAATITGGHAEAPQLEVSVGSTPTFWHFTPTRDEHPGGVRRVTEVRPGNYVFHDLTMVGLGAARLDDCALSVLATVVSRRRRDGRTHLLLDAGKKTLTSDRRVGQAGYGGLIEVDGEGRRVLARDVGIHALSEEHGWVDAPTDVPWQIGDRVQVAVNHACVVVSTQSSLWEVEDDAVVSEIAVDARGCSL